MNEEPTLRQRTARSVKWSVVERLSTQVIYALTGIILARLISPSEFGLVGAVLVFQAFANLFVDSGFASALIQRKEPTERDYSTVFWFNMLMAVGLYVVLWFCAPLIADWFQGEERLVMLGRVMFLTFILNAAGIVQTNRLVKQMNVKPVAVANTVGLLIGAGVGIWLAFERRDAWALVWQSVVTAGAKSLLLWLMVRWRPMMVCSLKILRGFFAVGSGIMLQTLLNVIFQNIYSFFIGHRLGMRPLGYYTQADKWSKMPTASLCGVLTQSFLPALSAVQDQPERLGRLCGKMHRATAYVVFFGFGWLMVAAAPIFHALFGSKWDPAIILFQLLMLRGIMVVLGGLYTNFILAVGHSRLLVWSEALRDGAALLALFACFPWLADPRGLEWMLWGQIAASFITLVVALQMAAGCTGRSFWLYVRDLGPYVVVAALALVPAWWLVEVIANPWIAIVASGVAGCGCYLLLNLRSVIQKDLLSHIKL